MPIFTFTAGSLGDILATAGLAAKVAQSIYDNRNMARECEILSTELKSLHQILIVTEFALQRYGSTPLGEPLAYFIQPEVAQCHLSLEQFSENVDACRQGLSSTTISSFWRKIIWAASDEAVSLSAKLSNHRLKLVMLLISLNCVGFLDSGFLDIRNSQLQLQNRPTSLRRIKDNTISVVDHLGDTIPVSTLFCATWEAFHYILAAYSKDRIGQRYVERGDYQIVQPENDKTISHLEFTKVVKEGQTIEISIILRSTFTVREDERRCPRCLYLDRHVPTDSGWIRCQHCSGQFHVNYVPTHELSAITELGDEAETGAHNNKEPGIGQIDDDMKTRMEEDKSAAFEENGQAEFDDQLDQRDTDTKYFRRITLEVQQGALVATPTPAAPLRRSGTWKFGDVGVGDTRSKEGRKDGGKELSKKPSTGRRTTLTVTVEPFSRSIRNRKDKEKDKEKVGKSSAASAGSFSPSQEFGVGVGSAGLDASTSKAKKVMQWFRTKSKGRESVGFGEEGPEKERDTTLTPTSGSEPSFVERFRNSVTAGGPERRTSALASSTPGLFHHPPHQDQHRNQHTPTHPYLQLRIHRGAVDRTTITTRPPPEVIAHVRRVLEGMGVEVQMESKYKVRCIRRKRGAAGGEGGGGLGQGGQLGLAVATMMGSTASNSEPLSMDNNNNTSSPLSPVPSSRLNSHPDGPVYGDPSQDTGDEVRFSVELKRLDRLNDTYSLDIRRLRGNLRSYKFLYDTLRHRVDLSASQV